MDRKPRWRGWLGRAIAGLIAFNRALSALVHKRLEDTSDRLYRAYDELVVASLPEGPSALVADLGGGRRCSFATRLPGGPRPRIVAVDVSAEELALNEDVDEARVADIAHGLPFADGEVDLVTTRAVLEHVSDVDAFFAHVARVLAPGGHTIHLAPSRYSLFATAARLLPFGPTKALLHRIYPETKDVVEFPVFYDRCYPAALERTLERHGFTNVQVRVSYNQTDYFSAFFPAYLLCLAYETIIRRLGLRDLAAYTLISAEKPQARSPTIR